MYITNYIQVGIFNNKTGYSGTICLSLHQGNVS